MRKRNEAGVFRITGARQGLQEDVRARQRRYVISMTVRTIAVILTVMLWNVERPVAIVTLVVGLVLPYVAVVVANAGRENTPALPSTFVKVPTRPVLTAPPEPGPSEPRTESAERVPEGGRATTGSGAS